MKRRYCRFLIMAMTVLLAESSPAPAYGEVHQWHLMSEAAPQGEEIVEIIHLEDNAIIVETREQAAKLLIEIVKSEVQEETADNLLGNFQVTGYCSCEECCGSKKEKLTKAGTKPESGHTIAADLEVLPLGSRVKIDDVIYTVEDTGKLVKGNVIDIYFDTHKEAVICGRQMKEVYLVL